VLNNNRGRNRLGEGGAINCIRAENVRNINTIRIIREIVERTIKSKMYSRAPVAPGTIRFSSRLKSRAGRVRGKISRPRFGRNRSEITKIR